MAETVSDHIVCRRCGQNQPKMPARPFKGPLGEQVWADVCAPCWNEVDPHGHEGSSTSWRLDPGYSANTRKSTISILRGVSQPCPCPGRGMSRVPGSQTRMSDEKMGRPAPVVLATVICDAILPRIREPASVRCWVRSRRFGRGSFRFGIPSSPSTSPSPTATAARAFA